jgi:hypothetical protein
MDRFYEDDSNDKSLTRIATATISKSMDLDSDFICRDMIWSEEADFIEHTKLSIGTDSKRCFSVFANFTRQEEKEVNSACKHTFGEIVAESTLWSPSRLGGLIVCHAAFEATN